MRATKVSAASESQRMFDNDVLEFFSRIPPWQPPAIYLPLIGYLTWAGLTEAAVPVATFALLALGGALMWTLFEYWAHRKLFHYHPTTELGRRFIWYMHGVHHDWPNDKLRLVFPPSLSLPLAGLFWLFFSWALGEQLRYPAMAGMAFGYLSYDMIHYWVHHFSPRSRAGKWLRRYHLEHHFKNPEQGFGVSQPLWDYVFGTVPDGSRRKAN